jgi:sulfatase-modifying factor enzyme 1
MSWIPSGAFLMGSEDFYPEERPVHRVTVDGFWIDERPVTGGEFRRFVRDTGYVSFCERPIDPTDYPGADPDVLVPGSLVFRKTAGPVDLRDFRNWWECVPGVLMTGVVGQNDPVGDEPVLVRERANVERLGSGQSASSHSKQGRAGSRPTRFPISYRSRRPLAAPTAPQLRPSRPQ